MIFRGALTIQGESESGFSPTIAGLEPETLILLWIPESLRLIG
ncbi:hypothetical protein [Prochlorothrix hollandica]|nr:hypothetical protein [Prochlorothrix hollandica]